MPDDTTSDLRASLALALRDACQAGRGVPPAMEQAVRHYARALRLDGVVVEKMLIDVKALVRAETGHDEPLFIPRVVGWAVAGYFAGTSPTDPRESR